MADLDVLGFRSGDEPVIVKAALLHDADTIQYDTIRTHHSLDTRLTLA